MGNAVDANDVRLGEQELGSSEQHVLTEYTNVFSQKPFMYYQAQGLPSFPLLNAYKEEKEDFKRTVKIVPIYKTPKNANVITSHVLYKVKTNDENSLKMKAGIAPHGNKNSEKLHLKTASAACPPTGIRILLSLATIFKLYLPKIDFKMR